MTAGWVGGAADAFWRLAGDPPDFPRDLGRSLALAMPVSCVLLDALAVAEVEAWLRDRRIAYRFEHGGEPERRLRGCLVAYSGHGLIFVDGTDDPAEQRFTVAHEIAHYLLDYHQPRETALARLGEEILPVLDGERLPTLHERIDSALAACPTRVFVHLLEPRGTNPVVAAAERRADLLAYELLAPAAALTQRRDPLKCNADDIAALLGDTFGLPPAEAATYARHWLHANRSLPASVPWLRR
jgi:hypothetical protein